MAEVVSRLGVQPVGLVTSLGADWAGQALAGFCTGQGLGMHVYTPALAGAEGSNSHAHSPSAPTASSVASSAPTGPALAPAAATPQQQLPQPQRVRTPVYSALLDGQGELVAAVADMEAFDGLTPAAVAGGRLTATRPTGSGEAAGGSAGADAHGTSLSQLLRARSVGAFEHSPRGAAASTAAAVGTHPASAPAAGFRLLVVDGNVPANTLRAVCALASGDGSPAEGSSTALPAAAAAASPGAQAAPTAAAAAALMPAAAAAAVPVLYEPISIAKGVRCVDADALHAIALIKPNRFEVRSIAGAVRVAMGLPETDSAADAAEAAEDEDAGDAVPSTVGRPGGDRRQGSSGKRLEGGGRPGPSQATVKHTFVADPAGSGKLLPAETAATVVDADGRVRSRRSTVSTAAAAAGSGAAAGATVAAVGGSAAAAGSWAALAGSLLGPSQASLAAAAQAAAFAVAAGADAAGDSGGAEAESVVDYGLLTAAQTVLSAMVRPGPIAEAPRAPGQALTPVVAAATSGGAVAALHVYGRALQVEQQIREMEAADAAAAAAASSAGGRAALSNGSAAVSAAAPATVEGRKHVLVTVGAEGVLWLSAPPAASHHTADLLASLPFFAAANHPSLGLDFKLLPAPAVQRVAKVTGAGDTFAGAVVASLARGCTMAQSLWHALAAAKIAIETEPGAVAAGAAAESDVSVAAGGAGAAAATAAASSTISPRLTWGAVCAEARAHVAPVEEGYD